jgi:hypothetical protein
VIDVLAQLASNIALLSNKTFPMLGEKKLIIAIPFEAS